MSQASRRPNLSRRGLLTAGAAIAAVGVSQAVLSARQASAADGSPLVLGQTNTSSTTTGLTAATTVRVGLIVESDGEFNDAIRGVRLQPGGSAIEGNANVGDATGVLGVSESGKAIVAISTTGVALQVRGRFQSTDAGMATIPQGKRSVTVLGNVTAGSAVVATVNGLPQANVYVASARAALPNKIVITLNVAAPKPTKVAYFMLEQVSS